MDRREMLKGAAAAMTGLAVVNNQLVATGGPFQIGSKPTDFDFSTMDATVWAREFVARFGGDEELMRAWFANSIMAGYDEANRRRDKAYDPVAVLEAMRERGFIVEVGNANAAKNPWLASILGQHGPEFCTNWLPDFRSAVLWLHKQAAAADAEFAAMWPVPAEVKQDG